MQGRIFRIAQSREDGETVVITRHDKAIAELGPSRSSLKAAPRFGTLKGKVKLLDPQLLRR
jgi:antitoxin (DNA-binding transcriptional repressor) of toxin-antitoxin stability system